MSEIPVVDKVLSLPVLLYNPQDWIRRIQTQREHPRLDTKSGLHSVPLAPELVSIPDAVMQQLSVNNQSDGQRAISCLPSSRPRRTGAKQNEAQRGWCVRPSESRRDYCSVYGCL